MRRALHEVWTAAWCSVVAAAALLFFQPQIQAQNITGEIDGTVTDSSGGVLPGATVQILNADTKQLVRTVTTNEKGDYTAPLLQVGTYNLTASDEGFEENHTNGIQVNVGDTLTVNLKLVVGQASSSVTVEANTNGPDVETPESATVVGESEMKELALSTRNFEQMLLLQPGVSYGGPDEIFPGIVNPSGQSNHPNLSINGLLPNQLTWLMDGADMLNHGGSVQVTVFPSVDEVQQIKVIRNSYGAEYGGGGSAQVLVVTKAGGSAYHGDALYFWRNKVLNATPYPDLTSNPRQPNPPIQYNNFGATIGGPLGFPKFSKVPRTYFFFGAEAQLMVNYPLNNLSNFPSLPQANGYFANPVCVVTNSSTNKCQTRATQVTTSPYSGYNFQVPASLFDPVNGTTPTNAYLKDIIFPALGVSGPNGGANSQNLILQQRSDYSHIQELFRLDHQFNERFSGFLRYIFDPINQTLPGHLYGTSGFPNVSNSKVFTYGENIAVHGTFTATPTMVMDFGASFEPYELLTTPTGNMLASKSPDVASAIALPYQSYRPSVPNAQRYATIPGLTINGTAWDTLGPYRDYGHTVQAFENTTKQLHQHTLYFGVNWEHYFVWTDSPTQNNSGSIAFTGGSSSVTTGGLTYKVSAFEAAFANFLVGNVNSFTQASIDGVAKDAQSLYEVYLQDDWRISPRLTLNLGTRYSIYGEPYDRGNHLAGFQPEAYNAAQAPAIGTSGTICYDTTTTACSATTPNANYNPLNGIVYGGTPNSPYGSAISRTPLLNFAPRVGFALNVFGNGKTSLRGGYGIFYDQAQLSIVEGLIMNTSPYVVKPTWNTKPMPFNNPANSQPGMLTIDGQVRNWRQPYTQGWSLDLQQQLDRTTVMDLAYVGNNTQHLPGEEDLNQPLPGEYINAGLAAPITSGASTSTLNQIRPYLGYGAIEYVSTRFFSDYNALQASVMKRFSKGSMVVLNYTWSKALANNLGMTQSPPVDPQNRYDLASEWGPTALDRRQIFIGHFIYELPFFRSQHGFAGKALGGWELSGIAQMVSGNWFTVTQNNDDPAGQGILFNGSNAQSRLDMVGNPNRGPKNFQQYFNPLAFAQVPAGQYRPGNEKPGSVLGPGYQMWNLDLYKNFELADQMRFQIRAEAFNAFNHVNPSAVGLTYATPVNLTDTTSPVANTNYGTVTTVRQNRIMQLGAKFYF